MELADLEYEMRREDRRLEQLFTSLEREVDELRHVVNKLKQRITYLHQQENDDDA